MKNLLVLLLLLTLNVAQSSYSQSNGIAYESIINEKVQVLNDQGKLSTLAIKDIKTRYIILDFWATWCSPCIDNQKILEQIYAKNSDSVTIITISADKFERFVDYNKNWKTNLLKGIDEEKLLFANYKIGTIPTIIFLDKNTFKVKVLEGQAITIDEFAHLKRSDRVSINYLQDQLTVEKVKDSLFSSIHNDTYVNERPFINNSPSFLYVQKPMDEQRQRQLFVNHSVGAVYVFCYGMTESRVQYSNPYIKTYFCFDLSIANKDLGKYPPERPMISFLKKTHPEITAEIEDSRVDSCYYLEKDYHTLIKESEFLTTRIEQLGSSFTADKASVNLLIHFLEEQINVPIENKSGLKGLYNFQITYKYEDPKNLNIQLARYGLKLVKKNKVKIKMLNISSR